MLIVAANERQESGARVLITTTWSRRRAGVWFCEPDGDVGKWLLGGASGELSSKKAGDPECSGFTDRVVGDPEQQHIWLQLPQHPDLSAWLLHTTGHSCTP